MIKLKGKGDFEIYPSQIGVLPLGQISSSLQASGRYILETQSFVPNLSSQSVCVWYLCLIDTDCAFPVFGKCLPGCFGLPYKHNGYKEKVNYLIELRENESRKS